MCREPAAVDRAGALQVDAAELGLVRRQITQTAGDLATRLWSRPRAPGSRPEPVGGAGEPRSGRSHRPDPPRPTGHLPRRVGSGPAPARPPGAGPFASGPGTRPRRTRRPAGWRGGAAEPPVVRRPGRRADRTSSAARRQRSLPCRRKRSRARLASRRASSTRPVSKATSARVRSTSPRSCQHRSRRNSSAASASALSASSGSPAANRTRDLSRWAMPCWVSLSKTMPSCIRRSALGRSPAVNSRQPRLCRATASNRSVLQQTGQRHCPRQVGPRGRQVLRLDEEGSPVEQQPHHVRPGGGHPCDSGGEGELGVLESPATEENQGALADQERRELGVPETPGPSSDLTMISRAGSRPWISTVDFARVASSRDTDRQRSALQRSGSWSVPASASVQPCAGPAARRVQRARWRSPARLVVESNRPGQDRSGRASVTERSGDIPNDFRQVRRCLRTRPEPRSRQNPRKAGAANDVPDQVAKPAGD